MDVAVPALHNLSTNLPTRKHTAFMHYEHSVMANESQRHSIRAHSNKHHRNNEQIQLVRRGTEKRTSAKRVFSQFPYSSSCFVSKNSKFIVFYKQFFYSKLIVSTESGRNQSTENFGHKFELSLYQ